MFREQCGNRWEQGTQIRFREPNTTKTRKPNTPKYCPPLTRKTLDSTETGGRVATGDRTLDARPRQFGAHRLISDISEFPVPGNNAGTETTRREQVGNRWENGRQLVTERNRWTRDAPEPVQVIRGAAGRSTTRGSQVHGRNLRTDSTGLGLTRSIAHVAPRDRDSPRHSTPARH